MPLYPLGISRRRDVPCLPRQAAGSYALQWSIMSELGCAFLDAPHQAVPPMLHAALLDAIHRRICVLPVRYGVALREETEIRSLLSDRHHELLSQLSRLDGACEMGVQIASATPIPNPQSPIPRVPLPLAYLEQRRSYYERADEDVEQDRLMVQRLVGRWQGCYRQWRRLPATPRRRIRLAFLVERDGVTAFQGRVETQGPGTGSFFGPSRAEKCACPLAAQGRAATAPEGHPPGRCVVLGPWPPYSFVEDFSQRLDANIGGRQGAQPMEGA